MSMRLIKYILKCHSHELELGHAKFFYYLRIVLYLKRSSLLASRSRL